MVTIENPKIHGSDGIGSSNPAYANITISSNINPQVQEVTLLHEIIEIINNICDLALPHQTISTLETNLFQVIRDNKLDFSK